MAYFIKKGVIYFLSFVPLLFLWCGWYNYFMTFGVISAGS